MQVLPAVRTAVAAVKDAAVRMPFWPILRQRRIHVYNVGAPKTGTSSIARLFSEHYRSAHEPYMGEVVDIARAATQGGATRSELQKSIRVHDRRGRLECESNGLLMYVAGDLADLFPASRFICTVRPPRPWMRSIIDQHMNYRTADTSCPQARTLRPTLYDVHPPVRFPSEERALTEYDEVWNLDAYLRFYAHHYSGILDAVPENRLLFVRTREIRDAVERVADFVGVPASSLSAGRSHANKTTQKHELLDEIDQGYVARKIEAHCHEVLPRIEQALGGKL